MKKWLLSLIALIGVCTGCKADTGDDVLLLPREFGKAVSQDTTAVVLDVRREDEYASGHLKNAINIDFLNRDSFEDSIAKLDKNKTYYVYCRSGKRSHDAYLALKKLGLKAYDMKGGILAWKNEELPLVK